MKRSKNSSSMSTIQVKKAEKYINRCQMSLSQTWWHVPANTKAEPLKGEKRYFLGA